jgi:hypothetical protein
LGGRREGDIAWLPGCLVCSVAGFRTPGGSTNPLSLLTRAENCNWREQVGSRADGVCEASVILALLHVGIQLYVNFSFILGTAILELSH